jgi:hypothetical protein
MRIVVELLVFRLDPVLIQVHRSSDLVGLAILTIFLCYNKLLAIIAVKILEREAPVMT